jgi:hypothetical protein
MERNSVYSDNLGKERLEIQRIVNLIRNRDLQSDAWREATVDYSYYKINPENSDENKKGSDVTLSDAYGNTTEIDLKGFKSSYDTVALTIDRSYDGTHWFNKLSGHFTTDMFVFIDELGNAYGLTIEKARELADGKPCRHSDGTIKPCEIRTVSPKKAGWWNKMMKIPLGELIHLADNVPLRSGRFITGEVIYAFE